MNHTTEALAWALVHFLWQGTLIALAAGGLGAALKRSRPSTRYAVFCAALVLIVAAPALTFIVALNAPASHTAGVPAAQSSAVSSTAAPAPEAEAAAQPDDPVWIAWLVGAWLCGVVLLTVRSFGGWIVAQRLKRWKTAPAAEFVQRAATRLRARLDIRRTVRILESAVAEVPAAVGWLRPVILLPVSALTALTPEQIELLLAHELAHIRRHDYLVNLMQTAVETVLFYHPAVWWVSAQIRAEREHCCDDLAVQACGNVLEYANTLATLEGLRTGGPSLALGADGGSLLARIQRLLHRDGKRRYVPPAWFGALLPVAVVLAAVFSISPRESAPEVAEVSAVVVSGAEPTGFLGGLADAGYTNINVDEIITLKDNGVEPRFIKEVLAAGLGTPNVHQLVQLKENGVSAAFVASMVKSGLVDDLTFESVIKLKENDVKGEEMAGIRGLGFGPYSTEDIIKLRQHGIDAATFEALKEVGMDKAGLREALLVHENNVTADRIRTMKEQGFNNLNLEQIIKLRRAGII